MESTGAPSADGTPLAAKRFKPNSATETPTFIVDDKFVWCECCKLHVTYKTLRSHATKDGGHLLRLVDFEPMPASGALTIGEAEALIEPRTLETRRQRRKQLSKEKRASRRGQEVDQLVCDG